MVLTAVLVAVNIYYAWTTRQALGVARDAVDAAEAANKEARKAHEIAARGWFGAELVVRKYQGNSILVSNLGRGPARAVIADHWINGKPVGDPPQVVAGGTLAGHGQGTYYHGAPEREWDVGLTPPRGSRISRATRSSRARWTRWSTCGTRTPTETTSRRSPIRSG